MKKNLLVVCCLISGIGFSQNFTAANEMAIGDNQMMYQCDSSASSLSTTTGNGVTWDYSALTAMPNPNINYSIDANTNTTDFPNANKVINIQNVLTTYMRTSSAGRDVLGFEYISGTMFGNIKMVFNSDSINLMNYDFALNQSQNDVFSGMLYTGFGNSTTTGTSTSVYDGLGTLKLSSTVSLPNVSRHHYTVTADASFPLGGGFSLPVQVTINEFDYYDLANTKIPVFSFVNVVIKQNGALLNSLNFVLNTILPPAAAIDENQLSNLQIFPNPVADQLQLSGDALNGTESIRIYDQNGKLCLESAPVNQLSVAHLAPGSYTLILVKNGTTAERKFIRQ